MKTRLTLIICLMGVMVNIKSAWAQTEVVVPPSNRSSSGLEKNLLFYADKRFSVAQQGSISLSLPNLFDGNY